MVITNFSIRDPKKSYKLKIELTNKRHQKEIGNEYSIEKYNFIRFNILSSELKYQGWKINGCQVIGPLFIIIIFISVISCQKKTDVTINVSFQFNKQL